MRSYFQLGPIESSVHICQEGSFTGRCLKKIDATCFDVFTRLLDVKKMFRKPE